MNKSILIASIFLIFCQNLKSQNTRFTNISIYKKFLRAGSTNLIINAFKNPQDYAELLDTTKVKTLTLKEEETWNAVLHRAGKRKHRQMKIGKIFFSGEMYDESGCKHFYAVCSSTLVIDFTSKRNYYIPKEDIQWLELLISKLSPDN